MTGTAPLPAEAHSMIMRLGPLWSVTVHHARLGRDGARVTRIGFENRSEACSAGGVWVDGEFTAAAAWAHCADPKCRVGVIHPAGGFPNPLTLDELETVVTEEERLGWSG